MTDSLKNPVEKRQHIERYGDDIVLKRIYNALPENKKKNFIQYREKWNQVDQQRTDLPFPLCISLELVAACNLHCGHCIRNSKQWRKRLPELFTGKSMGMETFKRIVDECVQHQLPSLWLGCSGEGLLEKELPAMIQYAYDQGILDLILTTNGTLLTPEIIDQLLATPLTRLNVSLDAFTPETYRSVRGADLEQVTSALNYVLTNRDKLPVVRLTFIDLPQNRHEQQAFIEYWQDKVEVVDIQHFIDFNQEYSPEDITPFPCSCPWRLIDIMSNGDLVPCNSFFAIPDLIMGNIHEQSIKEIWDSPRFKQHRQSLINQNYCSACTNCFAAAKS